MLDIVIGGLSAIVASVAYLWFFTLFARAFWRTEPGHLRRNRE